MTDNILVRDASGTVRTMKTTDEAGVHVPHHILATATGPVGAGNPVPVSDNGGSLTVDGTVSLGTGSNTIGKLAANTGVDIGSVGVTAVVPGTGATNLGKAVDAVAGGTDTGVPALAVRIDTLATLTPASGDYTQLRTTSQGRLWVSAALDTALPAGSNSIGSVTLNAGSNAIGKLAANSGVDIGDVDVISVTPGTGASNLGKTVNAVAGSSDVGVAILGIRDDTLSTLSPADGDYGRFRMDSIGRLWANAYVNNAYDAKEDMFKVKSVQKKFRDSFGGVALDSAKWDSSIGSGGGITVGSGVVTLASGVTASAETWILSKETFSVPFRLSIGFTLSQRIANQTFVVEAISVDASGNPDGQHCAAYVFDGTSATGGKYRVQNSGLAALDSAVVTLPTTAAGSVFEIEPFADECWFHGGVLDSTSGRANSYRRHQQIPDPNAQYKVRLRWINGATAPASSTNAVVQFLAVQDYAELTAEITAGRGQSAAGQAMGVAVVSMPTTGVSGTVTANAGMPNVITDVASAALTATTTTGAITPTFGPSYEVSIPVTAVSGTSPTLDVVVQESDDSGTNWFDVYHFPRITAAGMYRSPKLALSGNRVRYVQTVGGTSPSFTRSVIRLQCSDPVPGIRQVINRSVVLTTLGSVTSNLLLSGATRAQLVVNIGAATTPPSLQLEGSEDNGVTWFPVGDPLNAVANSTVQLTVLNMNVPLLRAKVTTAGTGVTAGYVLIKGF